MSDDLAKQERHLRNKRAYRRRLAEWVRERMGNCLRIAEDKTGCDRDGWLNDAACFRDILPYLENDAAKDARIAELEDENARYRRILLEAANSYMSAKEKLAAREKA